MGNGVAAGALMGKESVARMENVSLMRARKGVVTLYNFSNGSSNRIPEVLLSPMSTAASRRYTAAARPVRAGGRILIERRAKKLHYDDQMKWIRE